MAKLEHPSEVKSGEFEVYRLLELTDEEEDALRADPEGFLRELFGKEHHINRVLIDTRILAERQCPSGSYMIVHDRSPENYSNHAIQCERLV